ncbi:hypothetical protein [Nocardia sp. NBC_01388]|uniref:hypothetical protein n=1 Tax=Nocardia sp. NBC_01388 TaxID=2903596 RepID=UPI002F916050
MRLVDWWDVVTVAPGLEDFYKNEHHGRERRVLDRDLMAVVFETRKRIVNGNDTEDQDARICHLRDARAGMN